MSWQTHRPETVKIENANGWVLLKKRLTAGERHDQLVKLTSGSPIDALKVNRLNVGLSKMLAYLVDWSVTDPDGRKIEILYQSSDVIEQALRGLPTDVFAEILTMIEMHDEAADTARSEEKNVPAGESVSSATSPSPESLVGATSGSAS